MNAIYRTLGRGRCAGGRNDRREQSCNPAILPAMMPRRTIVVPAQRRIEECPNWGHSMLRELRRQDDEIPESNNPSPSRS